MFPPNQHQASLYSTYMRRELCLLRDRQTDVSRRRAMAGVGRPPSSPRAFPLSLWSFPQTHTHTHTLSCSLPPVILPIHPSRIIAPSSLLVERTLAAQQDVERESVPLNQRLAPCKTDSQHTHRVLGWLGAFVNNHRDTNKPRQIYFPLLELRPNLFVILRYKVVSYRAAMAKRK